jgi:hypothetical protein
LPTACAGRSTRSSGTCGSTNAVNVSAPPPLELPRDPAPDRPVRGWRCASCRSRRHHDRHGRVPAGAAAGAAAATSRVGACFTIRRDGRDDKSLSAVMRASASSWAPKKNPHEMGTEKGHHEDRTKDRSSANSIQLWDIAAMTGGHMELRPPTSADRSRPSPATLDSCRTIRDSA